MKKGDIVICSQTEWFHSENIQLTIGDKYEITSEPFKESDGWNYLVFNVKNVITGRHHTWVKSNHFITLEVFREFKLRELGI